MPSFFGRFRAFIRDLRQPAELDRDMDDEMRFHIDMESQRLMARLGISEVEARRQAAIAFGGVEKYRGAGRDAIGMTWARGLSTDLKLGTRMLRKYPGLTVVALFALSLAIGAGAAYLEFINDLMNGSLPFRDADRVVGIQTWDRQTGGTETRTGADFLSWRESARSFERLAAYRALDRDLITDDGRAEPVRGVQITSSAFEIAGTSALLGRTLQPADEQAGAPAVVVIGYDLWSARFASDQGVIGRNIRLGANSYSIVGVMPAGFGLPINHSAWIPLKFGDGDRQPLQGPSTRIFGKLAPAATLSQAQAELDTLAQRAAADSPRTHGRLQPIVKPYVESVWSAVEDSRVQTLVLYGANVFFVGLLGLCGANIATLVFARTAARETELSVRTALGASRARIAGQLFAEALVLSSAAALIGLAVARYGLQWVKNSVVAGQGTPIMFWWNDQLAPLTIVYAGVLAVAAAAIVGVIPALKSTGIDIQQRLKHATGTTTRGIRFGGLWTGVIVAQVGITVIFIAIVSMLAWSTYSTGAGKRRTTFASENYLAVRLTLDRSSIDQSDDDQAYRRQFKDTFARLSARLAAEPSVASVTYAGRLPGMNPEVINLEIEDAVQQPSTALRITNVGINFLDTFGAPVLAGRSFVEADLAAREVAIVDRTFVREVMHSQDPLGRHIRERATDTRPAGPWMEIVGVVGDLTDDTGKQAADATIYRPAAPETTYPIYLAVRARNNTAAAAASVRVVATDVDPMLRLHNMQTLDQVSEADRVALEFFARLLGGISLVALLLAVSGVYALMSFTVERSTSEIGVRVALGANARNIFQATLGRAMAQVVLGVVAGAIPAVVLIGAIGPEVAASNGRDVAIGAALFATAAVALLTACACVAPARRAINIQPTDALKST